MLARALIVAGLVGMTPTSIAEPQTPPPWSAKNLQHFPRDISRDDLVQRMREFSFALGVRCEYCHVGDGTSLQTMDFASDDKTAKQKARAMLRMVAALNTGPLASLPSRAEPRVEVTCVTCHRGLPLPKTLQTILYEITKTSGAAAAVNRYRQLRQDQMASGRYNFGEWEINELARRLATEGDTPSAIAMLELNGEFYPKSAEIDFHLGELHLRRGATDQALLRFRAALEKRPDHQPARRRIEEIEKK
jgi:hypothetical protein